MVTIAGLRWSDGPVRQLHADDLHVGSTVAIQSHASNRPDEPPLADDDLRLQQVLALLDYYGGVIFTGPPGTSKSWYAGKIGTWLVDGDQDRIRYVQFHPSYQYEDFVQGFVPRREGGFELEDKHFLGLCRDAVKDPGRRYVLVVDELSRADPGRVFGEALTYLEHSKRGLSFRLASGDRCVVPRNLVLLATMNPLDRGVDEVDAAFERRFAKIAMEPDRDILQEMLDRNGMPEPLTSGVVTFFQAINGRARATPMAALGHTYFADARDEASLRRLWDHQLRFVVEKAFRLDREAEQGLQRLWDQVFESGASDPTDAVPAPASEAPYGESAG